MLRIVREPPALRHVTARFEPLEALARPPFVRTVEPAARAVEIALAEPLARTRARPGDDA